MNRTDKEKKKDNWRTGKADKAAKQSPAIQKKYEAKNRNPISPRTHTQSMLLHRRTTTTRHIHHTLPNRRIQPRVLLHRRIKPIRFIVHIIFIGHYCQHSVITRLEGAEASRSRCRNRISLRIPLLTDDSKLPNEGTCHASLEAREVARGRGETPLMLLRTPGGRNSRFVLPHPRGQDIPPLALLLMPGL